jgi:hypothetical protein
MAFVGMRQFIASDETALAGSSVRCVGISDFFGRSSLFYLDARYRLRQIHRIERKFIGGVFINAWRDERGGYLPQMGG